MRIEQLIIAIFAILCMSATTIFGNTQSIYNDKHVAVSLRMIGHQILLNAGDSTSIVLPIIHNQDRYEIQFESGFEFIPDELVATVDRIVKETGIASKYILEVEESDSGLIVYSYEMDVVNKSNIVPCAARLQPENCYNLLFTLIHPINEVASASQSTSVDPTPVEPSNAEKSQINYIPILIVAAFIGGLFFFMWFKKQSKKENTNLISLGDYQFDKLNTELLIDDQKIELTSKEADLLLLLYETVNTTVKREVLLNMVWGDNGDYVGRTLDVFISKLRKKLEADSSVKIVNIRGVGYKLVMNV